tara:strand:+ start:52028 stop:52546 length:519 start_codon:yes stop_codon:yes gene_type:complete
LEFQFGYLITIIGWIYVLYLSNRALKRADIARVKDSCIAVLEDAVKKILDLAEKENLTDIHIESHLVHYATKAFFRIKAMNNLAKSQLVDAGKVDLVLRTADVSKIINRDNQYCQQLTSEILNYCDEIEQEYQKIFFNSNLKLWIAKHIDELKGLAFGLVICASLFYIFQYF